MPEIKEFVLEESPIIEQRDKRRRQQGFSFKESEKEITKKIFNFQISEKPSENIIPPLTEKETQKQETTPPIDRQSEGNKKSDVLDKKPNTEEIFVGFSFTGVKNIDQKYFPEKQKASNAEFLSKFEEPVNPNITENKYPEKFSFGEKEKIAEKTPGSFYFEVPIDKTYAP